MPSDLDSHCQAGPCMRSLLDPFLHRVLASTHGFNALGLLQRAATTHHDSSIRIYLCMHVSACPSLLPSSACGSLDSHLSASVRERARHMHLCRSGLRALDRRCGTDPGIKRQRCGPAQTHTLVHHSVSLVSFSQACIPYAVSLAILEALSSISRPAARSTGPDACCMRSMPGRSRVQHEQRSHRHSRSQHGQLPGAPW